MCLFLQMCKLHQICLLCIYLCVYGYKNIYILFSNIFVCVCETFAAHGFLLHNNSPRKYYKHINKFQT